MTTPDKSIFKAYDIRGIVGKTLNADIACKIGQAFGSAALAKGQTAVVIGRDGRLSGPELTSALAAGLQSTGIDVIDLGGSGDADGVFRHACAWYAVGRDGDRQS